MDLAITEGYTHCDPERWLKVIPQLIAIMDMKYISQFTNGNNIEQCCLLTLLLQLFSVKSGSSTRREFYFH